MVLHEFHGAIANQETSRNGRPRGSIDRRLAPATADPDDEDYITDLRPDDSDEEDSRSTLPTAGLCRQDHELAPTSGHDVRQPRLVQANQGTKPLRPATDNKA